MTRREWIRLTLVMLAVVVVGLFIVFHVGSGAGTPTQRTP